MLNVFGMQGEARRFASSKRTRQSDEFAILVIAANNQLRCTSAVSSRCAAALGVTRRVGCAPAGEIFVVQPVADVVLAEIISEVLFV